MKAVTVNYKVTGVKLVVQITKEYDCMVSKIYAVIMCYHVKRISKLLVGEIQGGFRKAKSMCTTDSVFQQPVEIILQKRKCEQHLWI